MSNNNNFNDEQNIYEKISNIIKNLSIVPKKDEFF